MRLVSSTFALSTLVTLPRRLRADFEGLAGDALDLVLASTRACRRRAGPAAPSAPAAFLVVEALAAAEVQAAGQARERSSGPRRRRSPGLQRGGVGQRVEDLHGAQVGVQAQRLADAQAAPAPGAAWQDRWYPTSGRRRPPAARRRRRWAASQRRRPARRSPVASMAAAADERVGVGEGGVVLRAHGVEHLHALGDDLGADAVAGKQANACR